VPKYSYKTPADIRENLDEKKNDKVNTQLVKYET
jgi:hypothetical protein